MLFRDFANYQNRIRGKMFQICNTGRYQVIRLKYIDKVFSNPNRGGRIEVANIDICHLSFMVVQSAKSYISERSIYKNAAAS